MGDIKARISRIIYQKSNANSETFYILKISELDDTFTVENGVEMSAVSYVGKTKTTVLTGSFDVVLKENQCICFEANTGSYVNKKTNETNYQLKLIKMLEFSYKEFNKETIVEYLKKTISGITNRQAMSIVGKFGKDTMDCIGDYDALVTIPGITEEKATQIVTQHVANAEFLVLLKMLENIGVENATSIAVHIIEKYGKEKAKNKIIYEPYSLYEDGICDFDTAISIATRRSNPKSIILGYDKIEYIRAVILNIFDELSNCGHCCVSDWNLFNIARSKIRKTIEINGSILRDKSIDTRSDVEFAEDEDAKNKTHIILAIKAMVEEGILAKEKFFVDENEMNFLYKTEEFEAERYAAKKILQMVHPDDSDKIENTDELVAQLEEQLGMKYADCQKDAIVAPLDSHVVIITGGPGTGKTTTVKGVIEFQKTINPNVHILCAAPTGRASQRMAEATGYDAKTIHRLLEVDPSDGLLKFKHNSQNPLECDVLIIDEFSMVDIVLFGSLMRAIKPTTKIILVGDRNQLPSVGAGSVLRDMIISGKVPAVELEVVFRQDSSSQIAVNANLIKENRIDEVESKGNYATIYSATNEGIKKKLLDLFKAGLNEYKDIYQVQILCPVKKAVYELGGASLNPILRDIANPKADKKKEFRNSAGKTIFREGDKVMQLKNNYTKDVFNGDLGIIQKIDNDNKEMLVQFQFKKEIVIYEFTELNQVELAYATTIHKSQGSEYKCVIVPMSPDYNGQGFNSKNLLYTGITRAKDIFYFVGDKESIYFGLGNTETTNRCTTLCQRISGQKDVVDIGGNNLLQEL